MATVDHLRKRVEYLLGLSLQDEQRMQEAIRFQDEFRAKSLPPDPENESARLIRRWRDTRWSS